MPLCYHEMVNKHSGGSGGNHRHPGKRSGAHAQWANRLAPPAGYQEGGAQMTWLLLGILAVTIGLAVAGFRRQNRKAQREARARARGCV